MPPSLCGAVHITWTYPWLQPLQRASFRSTLTMVRPDPKSMSQPQPLLPGPLVSESPWINIFLFRLLWDLFHEGFQKAMTRVSHWVATSVILTIFPLLLYSMFPDPHPWSPGSLHEYLRTASTPVPSLLWGIRDVRIIPMAHCQCEAVTS